MLPETTDVFISGAGPVGLLLAIQLRRLGVSVCIVDAADKASPAMPMYGRACMLQPRTLELLDQLDLLDDLAQDALISDKSFNYRQGKMLPSPYTPLFTKLAHETFLNVGLNLRLKFSEDIFRKKLAEVGCQVQAPVKLVDFTLDPDTTSAYPVTISCEDSDGRPLVTKAKYIIGADGGGSLVRRIAQIPFEGDTTEQRWVRIDGVVKTDLPEHRMGWGNFETATHGQVLWAAIDHGATRIGYALSQELVAKYGYQMTQEQVVHEARAAVAPFALEFERVDWFTLYGIQQFVAARFLDRGRILLAGDAGHTHSSGSALGMNQGVQDATNLAWKLAGVLNGWYAPAILQGYSDERRAMAEQLIRYDKITSKLISGTIPDEMKSRTESAEELLREVLVRSVAFITGLGVAYAPNLVNDAAPALGYVQATPGHRLADALVRKPGIRHAMLRLYETFRNDGRLKIFVFTGQPSRTRPQLERLRAQVDAHGPRFAHAVDYVTIVEGLDQALDEHLGVPKFGRGYWDLDASAHAKFGLGAHLGGIVVVRPDAMVGTTAALDGFARTVVPYLERFVIPREPETKAVVTNGNYGVLINPFESNLEGGKVV